MSYTGTASAAFIPQVYRNTRVATRKRRAAPQLPSTIFTQVMSYVPEECPVITYNAERCGASLKYRNRLNQELMNCSRYCFQNRSVWLSSILHYLAQEEDISFLIPDLNREYENESIRYIAFTASSTSSNIKREITLYPYTSRVEIDNYIATLLGDEDKLEIVIHLPLPDDAEEEQEIEEQKSESLWSVIGVGVSIPVKITNSLFTTSMLQNFDWSGEFDAFESFYLIGTYLLGEL